MGYRELGILAAGNELSVTLNVYAFDCEFING